MESNQDSIETPLVLYHTVLYQVHVVFVVSLLLKKYAVFSPPPAFICPEDLRYQACLPACTAQTCSNHDFDYDPEQCSGLTEGCVCPEGTLLHRPYSALCIPPEKCGECLPPDFKRPASTQT